MPTVDAVFENGVFKPKTPVNLAPGAKVEIFYGIELETALEAEVTKRYPKTWGGFSPDAADELQMSVNELRNRQLEQVREEFRKE